MRSPKRHVRSRAWLKKNQSFRRYVLRELTERGGPFTKEKGSEDDAAVAWHTPERTARWLAMMAPLRRARLEACLARDERAVSRAMRRSRSITTCVRDWLTRSARLQ